MSTLLRSNLPHLYLEDALPFIESVIELSHEQYPAVYEKVFNVKSMKNGIAQHTQVSELGPAASVAEGEVIPQDRVYQGYSKTYLATKYGTLLVTSQESIDHEKFDSISKNAAKLGRSMRSAMEIVAATIFNNGFATTGPDGVVLFSASHPLLAPGAGSGSNTLAAAADLSITSLKDLLTVVRKTVDSAGNKVMWSPKTLLVPPELEFEAHELLKSAYLPGGSNNNVNSVNSIYGMEPAVWNYLTDADAWFLCGGKEDHELNFFIDKPLEVKSEMEFKTDSAMTRSLSRFTCGYSDWRGVAGSPGA